MKKILNFYSSISGILQVQLGINQQKYGRWREAITFNIKKLETHGCVHNTVATDALMLKQQTISIHSVFKISIELE